MKEAVLFSTEADFRAWFERNLDKVGVRQIVLSQEVCPDYVVIMEDGKPAKMEAELFAVNFKYHGHDAAKVDYILACYSKTGEVEGVPVIAINKLWCFDAEPLPPLPADAPLSEEEARLLSAIYQSGGLSISALSSGKLAGDQQLFMRLPPGFVARFPRGRIEESVFNVISPSAKDWLKKYHHILVGAGISERACDLIESLLRRGLVEYRPIPWISSAFDGVVVDHPGWVPIELHAKPKAWECQKDAIVRHLLGK